MLTILGLGLLGISAAAFRTLYQTPSESVDRAFLNVIEKTTSRLLKIIFLPLDFLIACKDAVLNIIFSPFRVISMSVSRVVNVFQALLESAKHLLIWLLNLPAQLLSSMLSGSKHIFLTAFANTMKQLNSPKQFLSSLLSGSKNILKVAGTKILDQFNRLGGAADVSFVGIFIEKLVLQMSSSIHRAKIQWIILNHRVSDNLAEIETFGNSIIQELNKNIIGIFEVAMNTQCNLTKYVSSIQHGGKEYVEIMAKGYNSLNQKLAHFTIVIQDWFRSLSGVF